jgi:hypothetical protein
MGILFLAIITGILLFLMLFVILFVTNEDLIQTEGKRARQIIDQITHEFLEQIYSQTTYQEEQNESLK